MRARSLDMGDRPRRREFGWWLFPFNISRWGASEGRLHKLYGKEERTGKRFGLLLL
jgi:hypothetical protein